MIVFHPAASESEACWETFLNDLYQRRSFKGNRCELIATDGGTGLHAALILVYPKIVLQRCWAHKTRNVFAKAKKKDQLMVKKALNQINMLPLVEKRFRPIGDFLPAGEKRIPGRWLA